MSNVWKKCRLCGLEKEGWDFGWNILCGDCLEGMEIDKIPHTLENIVVLILNKIEGKNDK